MKVVVVTGGIGSGKSAACRYLHSKYGWPVFEADSRVKELYKEHPTLLYDIEDSLGVSLRDSSGNFEPQLLAGVIFNDSEALEKVENLVFPVLTEDFKLWKEQNIESRFGLLESATILQKPQLKGMGDVTVLVDAPVDIRMERAAARNGVSRETICKRMESQLYMNDISNGTVECPADFLVTNSGTLSQLEKKMDKLVEIIL